MKALERIEEMKPPTDLTFMNTHQDFIFLKRAFEVMREIAIGFADPGEAGLKNDQISEMLNEEFEKRMSQGEGK